MLKFAMIKLLNTELIQDVPIFFKFMQVHVNKEGQAISLAKQAKCVLSSFYNKDTNNKKRRENAKSSNRHYNIQEKNMCNIKM